MLNINRLSFEGVHNGLCLPCERILAWCKKIGSQLQRYLQCPFPGLNLFQALLTDSIFR